MPTLVERLREVTATESDDFFANDTLAYYLTKAKQQVVNTYARLERSQKRSFRALDLLRKNTTLVLTQATFAAKGTAFTAVIDTNLQPLQYNYLLYGGATPLAEIKQHHLHDVELGNIIPTKYESYYRVERGIKSTGTLNLSGLSYPLNDDLLFNIKADGVVILTRGLSITDPSLTTANALGNWLVGGTIANGWTITNTSGVLTITVNSYADYNLTLEIDDISTGVTGVATNRNSSFNFLLYEQDATKSVEVNYLDVPVPVAVTDTIMYDIPDRLDNAVIYGAATLLLTQESANNPEANVKLFADNYTNEVNLNAY